MTTPLADPQSTHNPTTGVAIPASWGDKVRDNIVTLSTPPGCVARRTTAQTLSTGTNTALAFNAADLRDTDAFHDTVTNNSRMTVPSGLGGWYWAGGYAVFTSNATGHRGIGVRVNGATYKAFTLIPAATSNDTYLTVHAPVQLAATDYVEIVVVQSSGGNLDTVAVDTLGWLTFWSL